jgi:hypothetical protein
MVLVSTETDDRDMGARRTERNWDVDLRGGAEVRPAHANRRVVSEKTRGISREADAGGPELTNSSRVADF